MRLAADIGGKDIDESDKGTEGKNFASRLDFTTFQSTPVCETPDHFDLRAQ